MQCKVQRPESTCFLMGHRLHRATIAPRIGPNGPPWAKPRVWACLWAILRSGSHERWMGHTQGKGAWGIVIRTVDTETHPLFGFERGATQAGPIQGPKWGDTGAGTGAAVRLHDTRISSLLPSSLESRHGADTGQDAGKTLSSRCLPSVLWWIGEAPSSPGTGEAGMG